MSIVATVRQYIQFSGDQEFDVILATPELADSPALQELVTLAIGNNTIDVPDVDDFTVHGVALIPPTANDTQPTLKGATGDTGIALSASQVSLLQFGDDVPTELILSVTAEIVGLRLVWF